ncbi:MAG: hypothetical protein R2911_45535 [Caldilineaceae bacterium]
MASPAAAQSAVTSGCATRRRTGRRCPHYAAAAHHARHDAHAAVRAR